MLFVPIPFVVALLLAILLVRMLLRGDGPPANRFFAASLGLYVVLSILIGLRWGYGVTALLPLQSLLAAALPPLAFLGFRSVATEEPPSRPWLHAMPVLLVLALMLLEPDLIDIALVATFLGYGVALLRLGLRGPDALRLAPLDEATTVHRALLATAIALFVSAALDTLIVADMRLGGGRYAAIVVGLANLPVLLLLGAAMALAGRSAPPTVPTETEAEPAVTDSSAAEDRETLARVDAALRAGLYRDPDLNLGRLARRTGLPARRISGAVNRLEGRNVSQYVNDRRIAEAVERLRTTDRPVTAILFEVGFSTKSNFNREFRRVTGTTPSAWRAEQGAR
jgi:AraC-like DNA-binding protein